MKKIIFLLSLFLVLNSCSTDDEGERYHFAILAVEQYDVPDSFTLDATYTITLKYYRPSSCHGRNRIYYEKNLNVRTIAIENVVFERNDCQPLNDELVEESFNFHVTNNGSYIFKFYKGKDVNGESVFEEVEVPVI